MAIGRALARRIRPTPPTALTAAAAGVTAYPGASAIAQSKMATGLNSRRAAAWQEDAWAYFDTIGPAKYAARYVAHSFSRLRLIAGVTDEDGENPRPISTLFDPDDETAVNDTGLPDDLLHQAQAEVVRLRSVVDGQSGILRDFGYHLTVPGDCNLVGIPGTPNTAWPNETWDVYSITQVIQVGPFDDGTSRWAIQGDGSLPVFLPYGTRCFRIYNPHPKRKELADSPFRGVLDDLEELALLKRAVRAIAKSRVGTSGMLLVPTEITDQLKALDADPNAPSPFVADLVKHLVTPLADEGSAANVVPHILEGAAEYLKEVRHLPFARQLEEVFIKLREEKLRDLAVGLDLPPEVLLGVGDVNHWGAAQISEDTYKAHIEPPATLAVAQLAAAYLRPVLSTPGKDDAGRPLVSWPMDQVRRIVILIDAQKLVDKPDKSTEALALHGVYALSDEALRRHSHFEPSDAPEPEEVADRVERERLIHARGALPEQIPPSDVVPTVPNAPNNGEVPPPAPVPAKPAPTPAGPVNAAAVTASARTVRPIGARLTALDNALQARIAGAAEQAVRRAIERVGARITSKAAKDRTVAATIRTVPKQLVAATLGRGVVASLDVDDTDLLEDDLDDFVSSVDSDVQDTHRKAVALLVGWLHANGRTVTAEALAELDRQAQQDRARGRQVLLSSLVAYARSRLYELDAQPDTAGEGVAAGQIPPGLIRTALAAYGGQDVVDTGSGYQVDQQDQPAGLTVGGTWGVATGNTLIDFGADQGAVVEGWTWNHGAPAVAFPPHEALDGQTFGGDPDADTSALSVGAGDWDPSGTGGYQISDHPGCTCWAEPTLIYVGDSTT